MFGDHAENLSGAIVWTGRLLQNDPCGAQTQFYVLGFFSGGLIDVVQKHCELQDLSIDAFDGGGDGTRVLHDALDVVKAVCHGLGRIAHAPDDFTSYGIGQLRHAGLFFHDRRTLNFSSGKRTNAE